MYYLYYKIPIKIVRLDDLFELKLSSLSSGELILFISFTLDNYCSFVFFETESKKVFIIGDEKGDATPLRVTDVSNQHDEDLFTNLVGDNLEQNFKR